MIDRDFGVCVEYNEVSYHNRHLCVRFINRFFEFEPKRYNFFFWEKVNTENMQQNYAYIFNVTFNLGQSRYVHQNVLFALKQPRNPSDLNPMFVLIIPTLVLRAVMPLLTRTVYKQPLQYVIYGHRNTRVSEMYGQTIFNAKKDLRWSLNKIISARKI